MPYPQAITNRPALWNPGWHRTPSTEDAWNRMAQYFSVIVEPGPESAKWKSERIDIHAANDQALIFHYDLGPYVKTPEDDFPEDFFAHDGKRLQLKAYSAGVIGQTSPVIQDRRTNPPVYGNRVNVASWDQRMVNLENPDAVDWLVDRVLKVSRRNTDLGSTANPYRTNFSDAAQDKLFDGAFIDSIGAAALLGSSVSNASAEKKHSIGGTLYLRYANGMDSGYVSSRPCHWNGPGLGNSTEAMSPEAWFSLLNNYVNKVRVAVGRRYYTFFNGFQQSDAFFGATKQTKLLCLNNLNGGIAEQHFKDPKQVNYPDKVKWVKEAVTMPKTVFDSNRIGGVYDASCSTSAPDRINSTDAYFEAGDVGTEITLQGAGASGATYSGTVTEIVSPTQVKVSPNVSSNVTAPTLANQFRGYWRGNRSYASGDTVDFIVGSVWTRYRCISAVTHTASEPNEPSPNNDATHWARVNKLTVKGKGKAFFSWVKMWSTGLDNASADNIKWARFVAASWMLVSNGYYYGNFGMPEDKNTSEQDFHGGSLAASNFSDLVGLGAPIDGPLGTRDNPVSVSGTTPADVQSREFTNGILKINLSTHVVTVESSGGNAKPVAPSGTTLAASSVTATSLNLAWTAFSDSSGDFGTSSLGQYIVERSTDGGSTWGVIKSNHPANSLTYAYSYAGSTSARSWKFRVKAKDQANQSSVGGPNNDGYTNIITVTIPATETADTTAPTFTATVTAAQVSGELAVQVSFDTFATDASGIKDYLVFKGLSAPSNPATDTPYLTLADTVKQFVDNSVSAEEQVKYWIYARDNSSNLNLSAVRSSNTVTVQEAVVGNKPVWPTNGRRPTYSFMHSPNGVKVRWLPPTADTALDKYTVDRVGGAEFTTREVEHDDGAPSFYINDFTAVEGTFVRYIVKAYTVGGIASDPIETYLTVRY